MAQEIQGERLTNVQSIPSHFKSSELNIIVVQTKFFVSLLASCSLFNLNHLHFFNYET